jgi:hypothetical protein
VADAFAKKWCSLGRSNRIEIEIENEIEIARKILRATR